MPRSLSVERVLSSEEERAMSGPTETAAPQASPRRRGLPLWPTLIVGVIVLDILAFFIIPPYAPGNPGQPVGGIADLIGANFEFPAPNVVWDLAPNSPVDPGAIVFFHPSISATILTMWIVIALLLVLMILATRRLTMRPSGVQNAVELVYEMLSNFATSLGGQAAARYVPLFAGVFLFVLLSNWSGLLPIMGKIEFLRAPTSDVNVTIGMALVSFVIFQAEGFRRLGFRGYLGKFFSLRGFKEGPAAGVIALYVGFIEFMLEFVKPVTLAMRLFGNIFGGEARNRGHHGTDHRDHPGGPAQPGAAAQLRPGPHLQRPDAHVHADRHRRPRGGSARRAGVRRRSGRQLRPAAVQLPFGRREPLRRRPVNRHGNPSDPGASPGDRRSTKRWNISVQVLRPSA